jgi:protein TonB
MPHAPRAPAAHFPDASRPARWLAAIDARWPGARRRAGGLSLALAIEGALFLALLTLGQSAGGEKDAGEALTTVEFSPERPPPAPSPEPKRTAEPSALPRAVPPPMPDRPAEKTPPNPQPPPAAVLPVAKSVPAPADPTRARAVVRDDMQGPMGPPDTGTAGDSQRVGSRANGEPVYAARWYREPTGAELRGYLSTASGPGWALITCKTVPGFRVEDCALEDEYPAGAQIGRAVLAAAWQFKVRPPQVGGRSLVGEWVRIRITYEMRRP